MKARNSGNLLHIKLYWNNIPLLIFLLWKKAQWPEGDGNGHCWGTEAGKLWGNVPVLKPVALAATQATGKPHKPVPVWISMSPIKRLICLHNTYQHRSLAGNYMSVEKACALRAFLITAASSNIIKFIKFPTPTKTRASHSVMEGIALTPAAEALCSHIDFIYEGLQPEMGQLLYSHAVVMEQNLPQ